MTYTIKHTVVGPFKAGDEVMEQQIIDAGGTVADWIRIGVIGEDGEPLADPTDPRRPSGIPAKGDTSWDGDSPEATEAQRRIREALQNASALETRVADDAVGVPGARLTDLEGLIDTLRASTGSALSVLSQRVDQSATQVQLSTSLESALKSVATKDEIATLATKDDVKAVSDKADTAVTQDQLFTQFSALEARIAALEAQIADTNGDGVVDEAEQAAANNRKTK